MCAGGQPPHPKHAPGGRSHLSTGWRHLRRGQGLPGREGRLGGLFWQVSLLGKGCVSCPGAFCSLFSSFSTRRRALYIVTYLLFPVNVLVGVLAGVWRMLISALYNAVHFCQLDISLLNRGVETFDPGPAPARGRFSHLQGAQQGLLHHPAPLGPGLASCPCAQKCAGTTGASSSSCCPPGPAGLLWGVLRGFAGGSVQIPCWGQQGGELSPSFAFSAGISGAEHSPGAGDGCSGMAGMEPETLPP